MESHAYYRNSNCLLYLDKPAWRENEGIISGNLSDTNII